MAEEKKDKTLLPSITAISVAGAFNRAMEMEYHYLFPRQEQAMLQHIYTTAAEAYPLSTLSGCMLWGINKMPYFVQQSFFSSIVVPNYDEVIMLRKFMIRHKIKEAVANNTQQIIFLGGGYDTCALSTAILYPEVKVYELERGSTRENKLACIASMPKNIISYEINKISDKATQINSNLFYLDCDLCGTSIETTVLPYGFNPQKKCLIIAEGLSMYLSQDENKQLLSDIYSLFQDHDSELLISYIEKRSYSTIQNTVQEEHKESYKFHLPLDEMFTLVHDCKLSISSKKTPAYMLEDLNKRDEAAYFRKNQAEHYFCIQKPSEFNNYKSLNQVPEMKITLPNKPCSEERPLLQM